MGNLELNLPIPRSPYSRKPIFNQSNNRSYCQSFSNTYSFIKSRTPRSNLNKSAIYRKVCDRSPTPIYSNKVYIDSRMIRSVIKDSSDRGRDSTAPFPRFLRNKKEQTDELSLKLIKNFRNPTQQSKQRYTQKSFLPASPTSPKIQNWNKSILAEKQSVVGNESSRVVKMQAQQNCPQEMINKKNPITISKIVKSNINTAKGLQINPQAYSFEKEQCGCQYHRYLQEINTPKQFSEYIGDVPTQRKKSARVYRNQRCQDCDCHKREHHTFKNSETFDSHQIKIAVKEKQQEDSFHISKQNGQKCQQIIKRIRNFNEFLNEVKRKIKKQTEANSRINNEPATEQESITQSSLYYANNSINQQYGKKIPNHSKSIIMALKLENQKIQLQKYKRLVEKQLSKQHSIESIEIQVGKNKEKIIKINLDNKIQKMPRNEKQQNSKELEKEHLVNNINTPKTEKIKKSEEKVQIHNKDEKLEQKQQPPELMSRRVSHINKLMSKIQRIQKLQNQNYKQIYQILNKTPISHHQDQI